MQNIEMIPSRNDLAPLDRIAHDVARSRRMTDGRTVVSASDDETVKLDGWIEVEYFDVEGGQVRRGWVAEIYTRHVAKN